MSFDIQVRQCSATAWPWLDESEGHGQAVAEQIGVTDFDGQNSSGTTANANR